jgi:hypothetical protein
MQIFGKKLDGTHITVDIELDESVDSLKRKLQAKMAVDPDQLLLIYGGEPLQAGTLLDYSVHMFSTILLTLGLPGGAL